jgi:hypothetical protein
MYTFGNAVLMVSEHKPDRASSRRRLNSDLVVHAGGNSLCAAEKTYHQHASLAPKGSGWVR